jgi:hypothetical protein
MTRQPQNDLDSKISQLFSFPAAKGTWKSIPDIPVVQQGSRGKEASQAQSPMLYELEFQLNIYRNCCIYTYNIEIISLPSYLLSKNLKVREKIS